MRESESKLAGALREIVRPANARRTRTTKTPIRYDARHWGTRRFFYFTGQQTRDDLLPELTTETLQWKTVINLLRLDVIAHTLDISRGRALPKGNAMTTTTTDWRECAAELRQLAREAQEPERRQKLISLATRLDEVATVTETRGLSSPFPV